MTGCECHRADIRGWQHVASFIHQLCQLATVVVRVAGKLVVDLEAFEVVPRNDIDHTLDRVGTVGRLGAPGQHCDTLDHHPRNLVDVGGRIEGRP